MVNFVKHYKFNLLTCPLLAGLPIINSWLVYPFTLHFSILFNLIDAMMHTLF
jgi:hypothetical protein